MRPQTLTAILASVLISAAVPAGATSITDGNFVNWSFGQYGAAVATVTLEASGGNPGARLKVNTITGASTFGSAVKNDFSTNAALSGSFTLTLDVMQGAGAFGQGQAINLLVRQGTALYGTAVTPPVTGFPHTSFDTLNFVGTFNASLFALVSGAGPALPDFSGATTTFFGFGAGNSVSNDLTMYYDNFRLDSAAIPAAAVPEPASLVLVLTGVAATWRTRVAARRRR